MANPKHPDSETHTNEDLTWLAGVELICKTEHISFEVIFVKRSKPCACCPCLCSLLLPPLLQPHGSACKGQQPEGPATPCLPSHCTHREQNSAPPSPLPSQAQILTLLEVPRVGWSSLALCAWRLSEIHLVLIQ